MSGFQLAPCAVVGETVSKPLLIRSSSSSKPQLCSCGQAFHDQVPIEIIPSKLFVSDTTKLHRFITHLVEHLKRRLEPYSIHDSLSDENQVDHSLDRDAWWNSLFMDTATTDFVRILQSLIHYHDLFLTKSTTESSLCRSNQIVNFCRPKLCTASPHHCSSLQLRFGLSEPMPDLSKTRIWSPSSQLFATELVMSWAKLSIEQLEANANLTVHDSEQNLCRPSYAVLENWLDLLLLGQLSSMASNSVQIEPERPSFLEEPSIDPERVAIKEIIVSKADLGIDKSLLSDEDRPRLVTLVVEDQDAQSNWFHSDKWKKLSDSWELTVHKRRQYQSTLVVRLPDMYDPVEMDNLIDALIERCQLFCSGP